MVTAGSARVQPHRCGANLRKQHWTHLRRIPWNANTSVAPCGNLPRTVSRLPTHHMFRYLKASAVQAGKCGHFSAVNMGGERNSGCEAHVRVDSVQQPSQGWKVDAADISSGAAQVIVGFQKRLGDCKAAERHLHDQAIRDKSKAKVRDVAYEDVWTSRGGAEACKIAGFKFEIHHHTFPP